MSPTHEAELRAAESRRVDGRFDEVHNRMTQGFAALDKQLVSQVDRIDALITNASSRAEITAIKLEEGVTKLAATVAATTETTRLASAEAVTATSLAFDNRLKPVEEAIRVSAGRGSVLTPIGLAVMGTALALISGIISHFMFR